MGGVLGLDRDPRGLLVVAILGSRSFKKRFVGIAKSFLYLGTGIRWAISCCWLSNVLLLLIVTAI
jgi:hypothetical protein